MSLRVTLKQQDGNKLIGWKFFKIKNFIMLNTISENKYITHSLGEVRKLFSIDAKYYTYKFYCEKCNARFSDRLNISSLPTIYSSCGDLTCDEVLIKEII